MSTHENNSSPETPGQSRRGFLALTGAGAAAVGIGALDPAPAAASSKGRWNPDPTAQQFTLAVMPDTQFLY
jgi:hypothetical protein